MPPKQEVSKLGPARKQSSDADDGHMSPVRYWDPEKKYWRMKMLIRVARLEQRMTEIPTDIKTVKKE